MNTPTHQNNDDVPNPSLATGAAAEPLRGAAETGSDQGSILIADDEPAFGRPLAELFRREGFAAESVLDAAGARAKRREGEFDVLIADINMPGNAALELVREIAGQEFGPPVIILTGSPTIATAASAVQLGAVAYLLKPIEFDDLLPVVRKAVSQYRTRRIVRAHRQHLDQWVRDVEELEQALSRPDASGIVPGDFVAITVNNLLAALMDFKRATDLVNAAKKPTSPVWQANTLQALHKSIDVLERTRRNFKSTELRDLRQELQSLVDTFQQQNAT